MLPGATEVYVLDDQSVMAVLKKLPTDNIITSLSYRAEPLYDPKHIFSKKWWAYLCPTFAHTHYPLQGW